MVITAGKAAKTADDGQTGGKVLITSGASAKATTGEMVLKTPDVVTNGASGLIQISTGSSATNTQDSGKVEILTGVGAQHSGLLALSTGEANGGDSGKVKI